MAIRRVTGAVSPSELIFADANALGATYDGSGTTIERGETFTLPAGGSTAVSNGALRLEALKGDCTITNNGNSTLTNASGVDGTIVMRSGASDFPAFVRNSSMGSMSTPAREDFTGDVSGTINSNATFPAGHIIQVKHKNFTTAVGYNHIRTTRAIISDFYQDITPKYSNSLILAQAHCSIGFQNTAEWGWFIDAEISTSSSSWVSSGQQTKVGAVLHVGKRNNAYHGGPRDNGASNFDDEVESYSNTVAHTPNSTNPIRYQVCFTNLWSNVFSYYVNRSHSDANIGYATRGTSTLTLYEVKQ